MPWRFDLLVLPASASPLAPGVKRSARKPFNFREVLLSFDFHQELHSYLERLSIPVI
jgi:hypothetical protein